MKLGKVIKVVQVVDIEDGDEIETTTSIDLAHRRESAVVARPDSKELVN
jgi:hypothetical protein